MMKPETNHEMGALERRVRVAMLTALGLRSIAKLAERIDVSPDRLYRWVRVGAGLSLDEMRRLAATLDLTVAELVGEEAA